MVRLRRLHGCLWAALCASAALRRSHPVPPRFAELASSPCRPPSPALPARSPTCAACWATSAWWACCACTPSWATTPRPCRWVGGLVEWWRADARGVRGWWPAPEVGAGAACRARAGTAGPTHGAQTRPAPSPRPRPLRPCPPQSMAPLHPFLRKGLFATKIPLACITLFYYAGFAYLMMQVGGRRCGWAGAGAGLGCAAVLCSAWRAGRAGERRRWCGATLLAARPPQHPAASALLPTHASQRCLELRAASTSSWPTSRLTPLPPCPAPHPPRSATWTPRAASTSSWPTSPRPSTRRAARRTSRS